MTSNESYLSEFFTPERLEWYRSLTERFPLWCGNWSEDLLWHPLAQEWSLETLSRREFEPQFAEEPIIFIEFHDPPTTAAVSSPFPVLYQDPIEHPGFEWLDPYVQVPGVDPIVYGALFASIDYVSYRWNAGGKAVRLPRVGATSPTEILPTLGRLIRRKRFLQRRMGFLSGDVDEDTLHRLWIEIGKESGLVPDREGPKSAMLDDEHLRMLLKEGEGLVVALRQEEPKELEEELVAKLQVGNPDHFPELLRLREAVKRPYMESAQRSVASQLERHGAPLDLDYWVYRLRFPMLRREEVRLLLDEPAKKPKRLARELLAERVGPSADTLAIKGV